MLDKNGRYCCRSVTKTVKTKTQSPYITYVLGTHCLCSFPAEKPASQKYLRDRLARPKRAVHTLVAEPRQSVSLPVCLSRSSTRARSPHSSARSDSTDHQNVAPRGMHWAYIHATYRANAHNNRNAYVVMCWHTPSLCFRF